MSYELRPMVKVFEDVIAGNVCVAATRRAESMLTTPDRVR